MARVTLNGAVRVTDKEFSGTSEGLLKGVKTRLAVARMLLEVAQILDAATADWPFLQFQGVGHTGTLSF